MKPAVPGLFITTHRALLRLRRPRLHVHLGSSRPAPGPFTRRRRRRRRERNQAGGRWRPRRIRGRHRRRRRRRRGSGGCLRGERVAWTRVRVAGPGMPPHKVRDDWGCCPTAPVCDDCGDALRHKPCPFRPVHVAPLASDQCVHRAGSGARGATRVARWRAQGRWVSDLDAGEDEGGVGDLIVNVRLPERGGEGGRE